MDKNEIYYIYENWQAEGHKARIHRGHCPSCNYGKGIHPDASVEHGCWHGPFETLQMALLTAQSTRGAIKFCKRCNPQ